MSEFSMNLYPYHDEPNAMEYYESDNQDELRSIAIEYSPAYAMLFRGGDTIAEWTGTHWEQWNNQEAKVSDYPHYTQAKSYFVHDGYEYLLFIPEGEDGIGWERYTESDYPERVMYRRKLSDTNQEAK